MDWYEALMIMFGLLGGGFLVGDGIETLAKVLYQAYGLHEPKKENNK